MTENSTENAQDSAQEEHPTLAAFLTDAPPGRVQIVAASTDLIERMSQWQVRLPSLTLYCATCDGSRFFDPRNSAVLLDRSRTGYQTVQYEFAHYKCRHCQNTDKTYALEIHTAGGQVQTLRIRKFGENPAAVGPTPRSLQSLLGNQWALYLQGRRSEIAGLGIGAFVYYRRVVEHVWQRVLSRLLQIAQFDGNESRVEALTAAKQESNFTRSMEAAKPAIPPSLYVDGHNPFKALYDACGDGVHEYSDEDCLAKSRIIRLVLGRFAERAKQILADDSEFREALGAVAGRTDSGSA